MEVKSHPATVELEIKKGDRTYRFFMEIGAPFGEAYDAAYEAFSGVAQMAKQASDNAKPKDESDNSASTDIQTSQQTVPVEVVS